MRAILFAVTVAVAGAALPSLPDCQRLEDHVLDGTNPGHVLGNTAEIGNKARPVRVGNLRSKGPIPTHHFASNALKSLDHAGPLIVFPYEAMVAKEGVTWDAYPMERWWDPTRTDLMEQQSAWAAGRPWDKLNDMGTNLKQMVSGPDGNPLGVFEGNSGVQVGLGGSQEPELVEFGDLYANLMYRGGGGSMEVPIVRGATLATHIFNNANPVVRPLCLSSINDQHAKFECPIERSAGDAGAGYLDGHCSGSTLKIYLHNSKAMTDFSMVQWAAAPSGQWGANHGMRTCDTSTCRLTDGGKTLEVTVPNSHGEMAFSVNVIGHYVLPWNWVDAPMTTTCGGNGKRAVRDAKRSIYDMTLSAVCQADRALTITVDLSDIRTPAVDKVQWALESQAKWQGSYVPGMRGCDDAHCSIHGRTLTIHTQAPATDYKLALNIIGVTTIPSDWFGHALHASCDGTTVSLAHPNGQQALSHGGGGSPTGGGSHTGGGAQTHTNAPTNAPTHAPTHTQGPLPQGPAASVTVNANTKFFLELDEPGTNLPQQTRKFVLYFSTPVTPNLNAATSTITFTPQNGGAYSGIVQVGYLGAGPRGDKSKATYLDGYFGRYPYKPTASSCVSDSRGKAYLSFDWHPVDANGQPAGGDLLMTTLPHQALLLRKHAAAHLAPSLYGYEAYRGTAWLLEYDVPHTPVDPDVASVNRVKADAAQTRDILAALERDTQSENVGAVCGRTDSYNFGKAIGRAARLASISRAFGTNHYQRLDPQIEKCLNKWLRTDDTLQEMWKLRYDTVWGGLFLRATNDADINFGADYGFPYYNDHHFHLGYVIYAAAYYVKYHQAWGNANKGRLYFLARDVGNPSHRDPHFPVVRHQDFYYGFSWASGVAPGERQEESASESLNCYHGLAALGDAMGDPYLKHAGQLHLAMELASVREYWQVRAHNRAHFPPMLQETGVVGQIAEGAWYVYTLDWPCDPNRFPMRHACLVGIQTIPITAVSKYWMDKEWAGSIRDVCERAINPHLDPEYSRHDPNDHDFRELNGGWKAFCYAAMAPLDAAHQQRAADYVRDKRPQELVGGTGAASTLLFIYGAT